MNKNTKKIVYGVLIVGVLYYLYSQYEAQQTGMAYSSPAGTGSGSGSSGSIAGTLGSILNGSGLNY
jgi:hypothetical protein